MLRNLWGLAGKVFRELYVDSGYGNSPFGGILPLKGGLLS